MRTARAPIPGTSARRRLVGRALFPLFIERLLAEWRYILRVAQRRDGTQARALEIRAPICDRS